MISHALPMNNPTQMLPSKSLNAAGNWAFLPRLTVPQRWSRRLSLCNFTSCSVPAKPSLEHFSHDLGIYKKKEKRKTSPLPLSFYPIVVKLFLALEIHENEKQRDVAREGEREGGRCSSQCQWIIGSLQNPIRKDGVETDLSVLHGRIRAAAHCIAAALLYRRPHHTSSHLFPLSTGPLPGN